VKKIDKIEVDTENLSVNKNGILEYDLILTVNVTYTDPPEFIEIKLVNN